MTFVTKATAIMSLVITSLVLIMEAPWAVVVAQLVERSLPILEVRGSNPAIDKIY